MQVCFSDNYRVSNKASSSLISTTQTVNSRFDNAVDTSSNNDDSNFVFRPTSTVDPFRTRDNEDEDPFRTDQDGFNRFQNNERGQGGGFGGGQPQGPSFNIPPRGRDRDRGNTG